MTLASLQALLALLLVSGVFVFLPGVRSRQGLLAACSAAFLWWLMPNAASWAVLGVFVLSGYAVARLLERRPIRGLLGLYLLALVASFLVIRRYDFVAAWVPATIAGQAIGVVGISYMLFRQIHFLVDVAQEQIERPSLWTYLNYQLGFLTILSGPIQRFQDFAKDWDALAPRHADAHALQMTFLRLMTGYLKLAFVAPIFLQLDGRFLGALTDSTPPGAGAAIVNFLGTFYAFPAYLYLNFSGYCDIVIAVAAFVGIALPENFDRPYLSRNVIDFWTRFHRTLGLLIRDYLFLPLYKAIAERWPKKADSLAFLCYFIAFFLAGVWHGPTANFVVYGLIQAIGVSAAKLWERRLIKRGGRKGLREYLQSRRIRTVAIVATLHFEFSACCSSPTICARSA